MKNVLFFLCFLFFICQMAEAQTPVLSIDAEKGFNGTTWQDYSGNNNTITLSSNTTKTVDGVYFDGNTSANLSTPIPLSNFTIYMTVKIEAMDRTLLGNGKDSDYGFHYQANALYTAIEQPYSFFNSNTITTNKQIVVTLTRDRAKNGGNISVSINGEPVGSFPNNSQSVFTLTNLAGEVGYFFKGWIKNIVVYTVVHTPVKIKNLAPAPDFAKSNPLNVPIDAKPYNPIDGGTIKGAITFPAQYKPRGEVGPVTFRTRVYELKDAKDAPNPDYMMGNITMTNPSVSYGNVTQQTINNTLVYKIPITISNLNTSALGSTYFVVEMIPVFPSDWKYRFAGGAGVSSDYLEMYGVTCTDCAGRSWFLKKDMLIFKPNVKTKTTAFGVSYNNGVR